MGLLYRFLCTNTRGQNPSSAVFHGKFALAMADFATKISAMIGRFKIQEDISSARGILYRNQLNP